MPLSNKKNRTVQKKSPRKTPSTAFCVYCGSGPGRKPVYTEAAHTLGRALAANGVGLVYGGGSLGLMGEVARATLSGVKGLSDFNTLSFSSRMASASLLEGGSMAIMVSSCRAWFCTMSRRAPVRS